MRMLRITDQFTDRTAVVAHDDVAATLRGWHEDAPEIVTEACDALQAALTPNSGTAHEYDGLAVFLGVTVELAE